MSRDLLKNNLDILVVVDFLLHCTLIGMLFMVIAILNSGDFSAELHPSFPCTPASKGVKVLHMLSVDSRSANQGVQMTMVEHTCVVLSNSSEWTVTDRYSADKLHPTSDTRDIISEEPPQMNGSAQ